MQGVKEMAACFSKCYLYHGSQSVRMIYIISESQTSVLALLRKVIRVKSETLLRGRSFDVRLRTTVVVVVAISISHCDCPYLILAASTAIFTSVRGLSLPVLTRCKLRLFDPVVAHTLSGVAVRGTYYCCNKHVWGWERHRYAASIARI